MSAPQSVQCFGKKKTGEFARFAPITSPLIDRSNGSRTLQGTTSFCSGWKQGYTDHAQKGKGLIKVNGKPLSLVQPEILRFKVCHLNYPKRRHKLKQPRSTNPS